MKLTKKMYGEWCYWDAYAEAFEVDAIAIRHPRSHKWRWAISWRWMRLTQPFRFVWYHVTGKHDYD